MINLSVSLVTYHPDEPMLRDTLASLRIAAAHAQEEGVLSGVKLTLVDNGNDNELEELAHAAGWPAVEVLSGHGNVGFGRGHNLVLNGDLGELHLILNPDVYLQPDALIHAMRFLQSHPDCGMLSPAIVGAESGWHFLCKRYPSILDLFLRGFAPRWVRCLSRSRMDRYEMKMSGTPSVQWDPPIVSGCFMLCRTDVLRQLGGFDPRYFLYFEDFDLSLRAGNIARLAAVSTVRIAHFGGGAARKGGRHIRMFCRSAKLFFSTHGWKLF